MISPEIHKREGTHLDDIPCVHVPLVDLFVLAAGHHYVLLVIIWVELSHKEHLALPKAADDLRDHKCFRYACYDATSLQTIPTIFSN